MRSSALTLLGLAVLLAFGAPAQAQYADLIITGDRIWTGDEDRPWVRAIAVRGDRIMAVGDPADMAAYRADHTETVEAGGAFIVPGFIDNHTHFNRAGELLLGINLLEVADAAGLRRAVRETAERLPAGAWMVGGMWGAYEQWALSSTGRDAEGAAEAPFDPDRHLIDPVSPRNPAILWNWDRSRLLANTAALDAVGADCSWRGVECEGGEPTGRVSEEVAGRIRAAIPPKTMDQRLAEARLALARLRQHGVTSFFDITPPDQLPVYQELLRRGELTARVNARPVLDTWDELGRDIGIRDGFGNDWIHIDGLKGFVDGIMGNSSAHFYEPYRTTGVRGSWRDSTNTGYVTGHGSGLEPAGNMERLVFGADSIGLSPKIHAIGDEAIDTLLDIYEKVMRDNGARDRRFAVIHNQVLRGPEVARRQAELGIIAEMQPYHTIDDMRWMEERIGERARWAYAFGTLDRAGVLLSFGSDWPGTNAAWYTSNPMHGIYAAVTRQTLDGEPEGGWFPEERIGVETALRAYTVNNAYAGGQEDAKGRLAPGLLADIVFLDRDPFAIPPEQLKDVKVLRTIVGGETVYDAEAAPATNE